MAGLVTARTEGRLREIWRRHCRPDPMIKHRSEAPFFLVPSDIPGILIISYPLVLPAGWAPGVIFCPNAGVITRVTCLSDDAAGPDSYGVDIQKSPYSDYGMWLSIVGSAPPTFSNSIKYQDATLTGWTPGINAGDSLGFKIIGTPSVATWCAVWLEVA